MMNIGYQSVFGKPSFNPPHVSTTKATRADLKRGYPSSETFCKVHFSGSTKPSSDSTSDNPAVQQLIDLPEGYCIPVGYTEGGEDATCLIEKLSGYLVIQKASINNSLTIKLNGRLLKQNELLRLEPGDILEIGSELEICIPALPPGEHYNYGLKPLLPEVVDQIQRFDQEERIDEKLKSGFKAYFTSSRSPISQPCRFDQHGFLLQAPEQEILTVDYRHDKGLMAFVHDVESAYKERKLEEGSHWSQSDQVKWLYELVDKVIQPEDDSHFYQPGPLYLGDVLEAHKGQCRHYALLFKVLADKLGLKAALISGFGKFDGEFEGHVWNTVTIQGKEYLVDLADNKLLLPVDSTFYQEHYHQGHLNA